MLEKDKWIHFVGIGGMGMSAIADILLQQGYKISGSDLFPTKITERLRERGAKIYIGHRESNIKNADIVVFSAAIKQSNSELLSARKNKIPCLKRAQMLGQLMENKWGIAVAGTHGKTTTTAMIGVVLKEGRLDPTILVGGEMDSLNANAYLGKSKYIVVEADEFDRSFLELTPQVAVITSLETEHLDYYRDLKEIKNTFLKFLARVPAYGSIMLCADNPGIQEILFEIKRDYITYGVGGKQSLLYQAKNIRFSNFSSIFTVMEAGKELGEVALKLPGIHNIKNALASVAVGKKLKISFSRIKSALADFKNVKRRFQIKGQRKGVLVIDDYAHHPTEIEMTLKGARARWKGRIIVVFQPHLYTRTRDFCEAFAKSLFPADILIVTGIYPAREEVLPGISGELIMQRAKEYGHKEAIYIGNKDEIPSFLLKCCKSGDLVITLGAGDIWIVGEELLAKLKLKS